MKECDLQGVLGLFPALESTGGIQASGKVAWQGIIENSNSRPPHDHLFCYGDGGVGDGWRSGAPAVFAPSKLGAVVTAFKAQWHGRRILIWHLGLLRLLPFFRAKRAEVILFLHGIEAWRRQDLLSRTLLRGVDLFLSNSDYTWRRFVRENPSLAHAPHRTVHLGIESPVNGGLPAPGPRPAALMLGRLLKSEDYKGHREMIGAWPDVLKRIPEAELWVAGEGDLRGELERLAAGCGVSGNVRFWGQVSEAKKEELLAQCRCLALPSRGEGFGLVYLEAMRMGRPCLISTLDAAREVVNPPEAGLAVDLARPQQLAEAVGRLLTPSPHWDKWSAQARQRYESFFTAEHFQRRLISALRSAS